MKIVKKAKKHGHRYPWDQWFARGKFRLTPGKDFLGRVDTFIGQIRNRASSRGLGVKISAPDDLSSLEVVIYDLAGN